VREVVTLTVSDLDADRMTLHIVLGKGAQDRYVPLSPRLLRDGRA
jgi:site-specific recombinase XerD